MSLIEIKKKLLMAQKGGADISELFNTSLWTGNAAARTITTGIDSGEGSMVWVRPRTYSTMPIYHHVFDTLRGALMSVVPNANFQSVSRDGTLTGFSSSGYSLGATNFVNESGRGVVGWQFRRAPKFFDIVQYTGDGVAGLAIAHNLGIKPGIMIVKRTDSTGNWIVYHASEGGGRGAVLNQTIVFDNYPALWNNSNPDASVFTLGTDIGVNASGGTYIAYLFAHDPSPEGVIQCGSYVGNGSWTGPTVNLGWRPQYLMIKNATAAGDWQIIDSQRGFTAANEAILLANTGDAETSANLANPSSTGFQIASIVSNVNTSGQTYIYMAIREAA